jgi:adrenodoxin-NADP+ reductase
LPALAFVSWYNGHPAYKDINIDFQGVEDVAIIGLGNVALDVARILLSSRKELENTDIPSSVLEKLCSNKIKHVSIVGRRGPAQATFSTKELRELMNLPNVRFGGVFPGHMIEAREYSQGDRLRTRQYDLIDKPNALVRAIPINDYRDKKLELEFWKSPMEFKPPNPPFRYLGIRKKNILDINPAKPYAEGVKVASAIWGVGQPVYPPRYPEGFEGVKRGVTSRFSGKQMETKAEMVIESVGYRSEALGVGEDGWSLPFDEGRGVLRNTQGRLTNGEGQIVRVTFITWFLGIRLMQI